MEKFTLAAFADEAGTELRQQIAAMKRNGITDLEIRGVNGRNVTELTRDQAREIRKALDDSGLKVWSVGSPIGKIRLDQDFEAHLGLLKHTLELGNILGAEVLRLFSFYPAEGKTEQEGRTLVMEQLGRMIAAAEGSGIALCHENEKGIYGDTAERCADIHRTFPELSAVFDPANFIQCGQDTMEAWETLRGYVRYFHVKDALPDGSVVPAGQGAGRLRELLTGYRAAGGCVLTLEPHLRVFEGLSELERKGERSRVGEGFVYASQDEAFDAAAAALKRLIAELP